MESKPISNRIQYLILALLMVLPGFSVDAQTTNDPETAKNIMGKILPPIDQNPPKIFETATFGLG